MEQKIRGNNNWANHYLQRLALLKDFERKVGEDNVPNSIKEEKFLLDNLVNKLLIQSQNKSYRNVRAIGEDGVSIRCSKEEYEELKSKISEVQGENGKYITEDDEKSFNENFKWDSIPAHRIGVGAGAKAIEDYIKNELDVLDVSADNYMDLYELKNETIAAYNVAQMNEKPEHTIEGGQMPIVNESKLKQIYKNVKGKINGMFSAINNRINSKNQVQVKENEEDGR